MASRWDPEYLGNSVVQVAGPFKPVTMPKRRVKVIRDGWYGADKKPVRLGQVLELPLDEAQGARALGRVEYA